MLTENVNQAALFQYLEWDTIFFGVNCAKTVLYRGLERHEWQELKERFADYDFVSIENRNSEPNNSYLIGTDTSAFLADINIQFIKSITSTYVNSSNISIHSNLDANAEILSLAKFECSKFVTDQEFKKRGGENVYNQWLMNSFNRADKYFALSKSDTNIIDGYILHSYANEACTIELIAVSEESSQKGIGTKLFQEVERSAYKMGANHIKVGTQARNVRAINFYNKVGCKQITSHQVYHLWNSNLGKN